MGPGAQPCVRNQSVTILYRAIKTLLRGECQQFEFFRAEIAVWFVVNVVTGAMWVFLPEEFLMKPAAFKPFQRYGSHPIKTEDPLFVAIVLVISKDKLEEVKHLCVIDLLDFVKGLVENFDSMSV